MASAHGSKFYGSPHYQKIYRHRVSYLCRASTHSIEINAVHWVTQLTAQNRLTTNIRGTHGKMRQKPMTKNDSRRTACDAHGKEFPTAKG
jgi:hypothetical protein